MKRREQRLIAPENGYKVPKVIKNGEVCEIVTIGKNVVERLANLAKNGQRQPKMADPHLWPIFSTTQGPPSLSESNVGCFSEPPVGDEHWCWLDRGGGRKLSGCLVLANLLRDGFLLWGSVNHLAKVLITVCLELQDCGVGFPHALSTNPLRYGPSHVRRGLKGVRLLQAGRHLKLTFDSFPTFF